MFAEHDRCFLGCEGKIVERDVRDPTLESQLLEGERWFETSAHDDAQVLRWDSEEFLQVGQCVRVVKEMGVVEDEPDRFAEIE
ncbi:hypothetical protein P9209_00680 [Prescottella defluvii]|nr:hypothetical protein P9209_00680 [Prescottella defluvii]